MQFCLKTDLNVYKNGHISEFQADSGLPEKQFSSEISENPKTFKAQHFPFNLTRCSDKLGF